VRLLYTFPAASVGMAGSRLIRGESRKDNRTPNTWLPKKFAGLRYYDTPLARPLWPFAVGAAITFYGVWKLQGVMMDSEQYYNDPRHPRFRHGGVKSSEKLHVVKETPH